MKKKLTAKLGTVLLSVILVVSSGYLSSKSGHSVVEITTTINTTINMK